MLLLDHRETSGARRGTSGAL